jgi:hypothetical protein
MVRVARRRVWLLNTVAHLPLRACVRPRHKFNICFEQAESCKGAIACR